MDNIINELLSEICRTGSEYDKTLNKNLSPNLHYKEALISELALYILNNKEKISKIYKEGYFPRYFGGMVRNQIISNESSFHKNVRKRIGFDIDEDFTNKLNLINNDDGWLQAKELNEEMMNIINIVLDEVKVNFFEREVFRLYYQDGMTYRGIQDKYDIHYTLAFVTVKKVLKKVKRAIDIKLKDKDCYIKQKTI